MRTIIRSLRLSITYIAALLLAVGYPLSAMAQTPEVMVSDQSAVQQQTVEVPAAELEVIDPAVIIEQPVTTPVTSTEETTASIPATADSPADTAVALANSQQQPANSSSSAIQTGVALENRITAEALTGNSTVSSNTKAGNATTGDAISSATLVNNVNSVIGAPENTKVANFTYDVMGDVKGDIMLYPLMLKSMLESQAKDGSLPASEINVRQDASITNDVTLRATSGDATVTRNTSAGNATTGSAHTVANVVNIVDSMISANQSFIGTVNIYGNLEGDILVAPDFIPQMIANNATMKNGVAPQRVDSQTTTDIINNISLAAESGGASVFGNTKAGDATSGSADTNVVIFNLTGHEVMAEDSVLVFINVLGKWVGVIVDAPTGATAAMVGSNVTSHTTQQPDLQIDAKVNSSITNNITLEARTGDAVVSRNTTAGNATSGNASASANVANIAGSRIGANRTFMTLFINVLGTWRGSFGIDTAFGNTPVVFGGGSVSTDFIRPDDSVARTTAAPTERKKITLIDSTQLARIDEVPQTGVAAVGVNTGGGQGQSGVLAATTGGELAAKTKGDSSLGFDARLAIVAGSLLMIGLSGLGLKWLYRPRGIVEVASLKR